MKRSNYIHYHQSLVSLESHKRKHCLLFHKSSYNSINFPELLTNWHLLHLEPSLFFKFHLIKSSLFLRKFNTSTVFFSIIMKLLLHLTQYWLCLMLVTLVIVSEFFLISLDSVVNSVLHCFWWRPHVF